MSGDNYNNTLPEISAIIVVKGKPPHLFEMLDSIHDFAREIVIMNIGIDDDVLTTITSKYHQAQVIAIDKPIPYVELIREESKQYAHYEWILVLDPDEVVSSGFFRYIKEHIGTHIDYVKIPRKNIIFDKWIVHARWWPDYQVRLFKKHAVTWQPILHAQPIVQGREFRVPQKEEYAIIHYNYRSIAEYIAKMNRYAQAEARERLQNKDVYKLSDALRNGLSEFISRYYASKGYRDGMHGFVLSMLQMVYCFLVYCYYWEHHAYYSSQRTSDIEREARTFFFQGFAQSFAWAKQDRMSKIKRAIMNLLFP